MNRSVEMRFPGQTYTISIPISPEGFEKPALLNNLASEFADQHKKLYGLTQASELAELVCIRTRVFGNIGGTQLADMQLSASKRPGGVCRGRGDCRLVHFFSHDAIETKIYLRDDLQIGTLISGPAIIEQYDTTTVLPPGWVGTQEASGNLVLRKKGAA